MFNGDHNYELHTYHLISLRKKKSFRANSRGQNWLLGRPAHEQHFPSSPDLIHLGLKKGVYQIGFLHVCISPQIVFGA